MSKFRKRKLIQRWLTSLGGKAPLSNNKGKVIRSKVSKRDIKELKRANRSSGRIIKPRMKWSQVINKCLDPPIFYDRYHDYWKDTYPDKRKNKKYIEIRKKRKENKKLNPKIYFS